MLSSTSKPLALSKHLQCSDRTTILTLPLRTNATWGLGRISSQTKLTNQDASALTHTYKYDSTAGANSDVYVIGTCAERLTYQYETNPRTFDVDTGEYP